MPECSSRFENRGHSTTTWTEFCHFDPPPLRGLFLYPERGKKQTFFDPLPPNIVQVVIECPHTNTERQMSNVREIAINRCVRTFHKTAKFFMKSNLNLYVHLYICTYTPKIQGYILFSITNSEKKLRA